MCEELRELSDGELNMIARIASTARVIDAVVKAGVARDRPEAIGLAHIAAMDDLRASIDWFNDMTNAISECNEAVERMQRADVVKLVKKED